MASNRIFADEEKGRRTAIVGTDIAPGSAMIIGGRPIVTITGSGDYDGNAVSIVAGGVTTVISGGRGGVGLLDNEATVTPTGTWGFPVAGASAATARGAAVYLTSAGALTLTAGSNTKFGIVEFFRGTESATDTAVTIGVNLG